jgi:hypothetical protein
MDLVVGANYIPGSKMSQTLQVAMGGAVIGVDR